MENDEETAAAIVVLLPVKKLRKKEKDPCGVKPWLGRRINLGFYETLVQGLRFEDESESKRFAWHHRTLADTRGALSQKLFWKILTATLLKRDSNTVVFLWMLRNF